MAAGDILALLQTSISFLSPSEVLDLEQWRLLSRQLLETGKISK